MKKLKERLKRGLAMMMAAASIVSAFPSMNVSAASETAKIEAESLAEAEQLAEDNWNRSQYILDADHFVGADFKARECVREKGMER